MIDYEKKYKEALERAREFQKSKDGLCVLTAESIFPELQESEDEKIRKALVRFHKSTIDVDGIKGEEIVAWLEKQGEKKPIEMKSPEESLGVSSKEYNEIVNECLYGEQKSTDKVEPKFHEGDFVVSKITNTTYQIESVVLNVTNNKYGYDLTNGGYIASIEAYKYHLWTIEDAKDGDVLVDVYGTIGIFQKNDDFDWSSYCSLGSNGGFRCFAIEHELDRSHPATKEQRDLLFQKIKEAGYQWDAEKKELKLLISNGGDFESNNSKQKPTWSKEDEKRLCHIHDFLFFNRRGDTDTTYQQDISWLGTIKERLS